MSSAALRQALGAGWERLKPRLRQHWGRLLFAAGLLAVFFGNQGFRGLLSNWLELRALKREIGSLEGEQTDLSARLKDLRSGDWALERMARRELGYIKKGEVEYRFPAPARKAP